jgi:hypothetical protein
VTSRKLRPLAGLPLIAMVALISACGSKAPAPTGTGSAGANSSATNLQQAVKFSQCMRSNGISDFPDPNASGQLTIDAIANGSGVDTSTPTFQQALSACKDLEPPGFTGRTRTAQQQEAGLGFAKCIRANGVPAFPDPTPDGPLVDTNRLPSAATSGGMSLLHAAMQKCGSFAAAAGVSGAK